MIRVFLFIIITAQFFSFPAKSNEKTTSSKNIDIIIQMCREAISKELPFEDGFFSRGWRSPEGQDFENFMDRIVYSSRVGLYVRKETTVKKENLAKHRQIHKNAFQFMIEDDLQTGPLINDDFKDIFVQITGPIPKRCSFSHYASSYELMPKHPDIDIPTIQNLKSISNGKPVTQAIGVSKNNNQKKAILNFIVPFDTRKTRELFGESLYVTSWSIAK